MKQASWVHGTASEDSTNTRGVKNALITWTDAQFHKWRIIYKTWQRDSATLTKYSHSSDCTDHAINCYILCSTVCSPHIINIVRCLYNQFNVILNLKLVSTRVWCKLIYCTMTKNTPGGRDCRSFSAFSLSLMTSVYRYRLHRTLNFTLSLFFFIFTAKKSSMP